MKDEDFYKIVGEESLMSDEKESTGEHAELPEDEIVIQKLKESPIFVYRLLESEIPKFIAFDSRDILHITECNAAHLVNGEMTEKIKASCVTLNNSTAEHIHIRVPFNELMLRWVAVIESHDA